MKNQGQCKWGLLYNEFSILLIQTFTSPEIKIPKGSFIKPITEGNIDEQLFTHKDKIVNRYELVGFDIDITIDKPNTAILKGHVHVWAAVFFNTTVEISYRIIVPPGGKINDTSFCQISEPFNTDQLIVIAGIIQHVEHWVYNQEAEKQEIDGSLKKVKFCNLHLNAEGQYCEKVAQEPQITFEEIQKRYRKFFDTSSENKFYYPAHNYIFIDIWESIDHQGDINFSHMQEDDIIQHIETAHQAELVGLMTLYPEEWPYRMDSSFKEVCGKNIAIDTDDLVLTNENMSVVFGTYGKRGNEAPTDWQEHLGRRDRYHVSWPEYLVLLEILLAKKHTINYVLNKYIYNSRNAGNENIHNMIEQNARLSVKLSNILLELDSVRYLRYMSHKHMFYETARNLKIEEDEKQLDKILRRVDKSLNNANNVIEIRQSNDTKYILLFISVASLFSVVLQGENVPLLAGLSKALGRQTAIVLVIITSIGIAYGLIVLLKMTVRYIKQRKIYKRDNYS